MQSLRGLFGLFIEGHDIVALVAFVSICMIPIVGIFTRHQRKMAEIIHRGTDPMQAQEMMELRSQMADLKNLVVQQSLAIDDIRTKLRELPARES